MGSPVLMKVYRPVQSVEPGSLACPLLNTQSSMYVTHFFSWMLMVDESGKQKDKPQCAACGIMSANLKNPICSGCITYYRMSGNKH